MIKTSSCPPGIAFRVEPVPPLEELAVLWSAFDSHGEHSFFLSWNWVGTWLRCVPTRHSTRLLRAVEGTRTVGMALLGLNQRRFAGLWKASQGWLNASGDPAFDCITVEYNGFATEGPDHARLLEHLLSSFETGLPQHRRIDIAWRIACSLRLERLDFA